MHHQDRKALCLQKTKVVVIISVLRMRGIYVLHNTQGATIDVPHGKMPNQVSVWLAIARPLILSSNYRQNVNCQSILYIIDHSHCHNWLYASFCWVVNTSRSHPLYARSLSWTSSDTHTHSHIQTHMNPLAVTQITASVFEISLTDKHTWRHFQPSSLSVRLQSRSAVPSTLVQSYGCVTHTTVCNTACIYTV